ncbi:MAG: hypothetical protein AAF570_02310 [Bacteroidota bacterium]
MNLKTSTTFSTFFLAMLLFGASTLSAQGLQKTTYINFSNQLALVSEPNIYAEPQLQIPFGAEVEVLTEQVFKHKGIVEKEKQTPLCDFQKVRYNNVEGYACTEYLGQGWGSRQIESEFLLAQEGNRGTAYYRPKMNWYGIYPGEVAHVISPLHMDIEMKAGYPELRPAFTWGEESMLLIAAPKDYYLHEGTLDIVHPKAGQSWGKARLKGGDQYANTTMTGVLNIGKGIDADGMIQKEKGDMFLYTYSASWGTVKQSLDAQLEAFDFFSAELYFMGDLNLDGHPDFIFDLAWDDGKYVRVMFLTTEDKEAPLKLKGAMYVPAGC